MALAWLFALQVASAPPAGIATNFDLAKYQAPDVGYANTCRSRGPADIVVCGRRPGSNAYPLEKMARIFEEKPLIAATGIGGGASVRAFVDSVQMPTGEISKRVMVGIKLPF